MKTIPDPSARFASVREATVDFCRPLHPEDYVIQPVVDVSPPKWHLAHTTWFFETFLLKSYDRSYNIYHPDYNFLFNSYYEGIGSRTLRDQRGFISRPTVADVYAYRAHVDAHVQALLAKPEALPPDFWTVFELGLQHEQQHQELLITDTKYSLGINPTFPVYDPDSDFVPKAETTPQDWIEIKAGLYTIGYQGEGFCFDNELGVHQVYLTPARISNRLVTNAEYLDFINDGGYDNFRHWLMEGWQWRQGQAITAPLHWHKIDGAWHSFELSGLQPLDGNAPLKHISYYEADAFARWVGKRLPTEFEWESVAGQLSYGQLWEWTSSAYLPYPHYRTAEGAIGEYNGKFMVNQMVLRGGSVASPKGHVRPSYRNFFHPYLQWQFSGIRLAEWL
ncbi:MAG: ergothioneine biosynthesis protein EgtB [Bernardetiaceae bacterium]